MRGNVIGFDASTNTGAISGHDGRRYDFATMDWHAANPPHHGDLVDFVATDQRATQIYLLEPEYVEPTTNEFYLSARGRISRSQFWLKFVLPVLIVFVVLQVIFMAVGVGDRGSTIILIIWDLIILWPSIAIYIKRAHDRDRSGWFLLLFLVPLLNLWPIIELWFVRGTVGANRFGPDPVRPS
jgi:uncharacterized membrane protein YhaH (DUF805 family)